MTIAVDLDNVIASTDPKIREIVHRISGVRLSQGDIKVFEYHKALVDAGLDLEVAKDIEKEALRLFHDGECLQIELVDGAAEGLACLSNTRRRVIIVTSRPVTSGEVTKSWLEQFQVPCEEVVFIDKKDRMASTWVVLIEDAAHHAQAVCQMGVPVVLLDYPWNRSIEAHALIHRAKDWREAADLALNLGMAG